MVVPFLENNVDKLNIDNDILVILGNNNIYTVKNLWVLKREDLKKLNLSDNQINQIVIKMQLHGVDLNKRVYNKY